jgi:hypothetical protein
MSVIDNNIEKISKIENVSGSSLEVGSKAELHFESWKDFSKYIQDIGKDSSLGTEEKIKKIQEAYENVADKTDINIPIDLQYVKGFDANGNVIYDWPKYLGFEQSSITSITKENFLPEKGDRYGYMGGLTLHLYLKQDFIIIVNVLYHTL